MMTVNVCEAMVVNCFWAYTSAINAYKSNRKPTLSKIKAVIFNSMQKVKGQRYQTAPPKQYLLI